MKVAAGLLLTMLLGGCISAWEREPPGIYPTGSLNGPPTYFIGWKQGF